MLVGPSGTGKTLSAQVIAGDLGRGLYSVDLSAVVSKHVGETERKLEEVLGAAEGAGAVFFFGEADALFGEGTGVKETRDRSANAETAYLLQRIEEHRGLVLLTANRESGIDAAFSRRMDQVVVFPMPDHELRLRAGENDQGNGREVRPARREGQSSRQGWLVSALTPKTHNPGVFFSGLAQTPAPSVFLRSGSAVPPSSTPRRGCLPSIRGLWLDPEGRLDSA